MRYSRRGGPMVLADWRASAVPFWVRHPHVAGATTFLVICALALLLTGCDFPRCGVLWPC